MAYQRPTQSELAAARKVVRQEELDRAIAEGRLTVRTMTAEEHAERRPLGVRGDGARRASQGVAVPLTPSRGPDRLPIRGDRSLGAPAADGAAATDPGHDRLRTHAATD
jgi:hypothetical protein